MPRKTKKNKAIKPKGYKPKGIKAAARKTHKNEFKNMTLGKNVKGLFGRFDNMDPFPPNMLVKFRYTDDLDIRSTTITGYPNASYCYQYNLNSVYKPYTPAGGHQPYGFDQLVSTSGPYTRFKVHAVMVEALFYDVDVTSGTMGVVSIINPTDTYTIAAQSLDKLNEKPGVVTKHISSGGSQQAKVKQFLPMHKLFEVTKEQFRTDITTTTGSASGSPSSMPKIEIGLLDSRGNVITARCRLTLTYFTQIYDRLVLPQS